MKCKWIKVCVWVYEYIATLSLAFMSMFIMKTSQHCNFTALLKNQGGGKGAEGDIPIYTCINDPSNAGSLKKLR